MKFFEVLSSDIAGISSLAKDLNINPLAVEDCLNRNQRAKLEDYQNHHLLVWFMYSCQMVHELEFVIFTDTLVLVAHEHPPRENTWSEYLKLSGEHKDIQHLLYQILDRSTDISISELRPIFDKIDDFEEEMFEATADPKDLLRLRKQLSQIEFSVGHLPSLVKQLQNLFSPTDDLVWKLRDLHDHCERMNQYIVHHRTQVASSIDLYWGLAAQKTNADIKKLSLLAGIALPLSFWTSFWGMNFEFLPFKNPFVFSFSLLVMFGSPLLFFYFLKIKGYWK